MKKSKRALAETKLPEHPDFDLPRRCASMAGVVNCFLIKATAIGTLICVATGV
jgi:hypothetical protein